ncbi:long-chain-fatty-acid--CoA ligase [Peribacillus frigoritolerans]|uniref:long-chain-fatty-acid--CoA ligase n=1 Tax=Peribacillus frigoritolerans TaxID=450367 RepID=UPI0020C06BB0|nr:long-chain-fatty-acid--CoA ligase [Peribacillus frigoritolerans]
MNLGSSLGRNARQTPEKIAVICEDRQYTYDQLNRIVNRFAHGLQVLGIEKGDKVAFMLKNSEYFPISYFAVAKLGGVIVPINCRLTKSEAAYIVEHSDAKLIIFDEEFGELIEQAVSTKVEHVIAVHQAKIEGHLSFNDVLSENESDPDVVVNRNDDIEILYTSGTTGKSKGVLFDHNCVLSAIINSIPAFGQYNNDRPLHIAPFFHAAQLRYMTRGIFLSSTNVILRSFDPIETLEAISNHKITLFFGVPTMYNLLLQVPNKEQYDLSSIKICGYGAAPMAPEIVKQSMEMFGTDRFFNQCGLTEGGPGGIFLTPEEHKSKLGASGKPRFLMEARVVDQEGELVAPGIVGELVLRGESVMKGYYKNPEATSETIRDGWLFTGDLCTIDEDGYITLVDRGKDMIISGGSNVYSVEVEQVLYSFPAVLEAAVIGIPDEKWGETVAAIIVPKPGHKIDIGELEAFCRENLAGYKIPRIVRFMDTLPRNASGKILKYELRKNFKVTV